VTAHPTDPATMRGQAVYTPLVLALYDRLVLDLSCSYAWRCPSDAILALYDRSVGRRHLDVGVGTGYFLDRCRFPAAPEITLLDLNERSLRAASRRIARHAPRAVRSNVLEPVDLGAARFDSIGMSLLLHCLPGDMDGKTRAIGHLRPYLAPSGVLFGATILSVGVEQTLLSRGLMGAYNRRGIFNNARDGRRGLERALERELDWYEIETRGSVALFRAGLGSRGDGR
jgi:SAM-dependent methyltransferase